MGRWPSLPVLLLVYDDGFSYSRLVVQMVGKKKFLHDSSSVFFSFLSLNSWVPLYATWVPPTPPPILLD